MGPDDLRTLRDSHLVTTAWLDDRIEQGDARLRIVDMRGSVSVDIRGAVQTARYSGARPAYDEGHIPGAVYLDWTTDLVDQDDPVPVQAAAPERLAAVLGSVGIGSDDLVVAYDAHPAAQFATRLWWLLRYLGMDRVRVLDGGWTRWRAEGRAIDTRTSTPAAALFTPHVRPELRVEAAEVLAAIGDPDTILVDARDDAQYTGAVRRGPRGGHIPGARSLPREALITGPGEFRGSAELLSVLRGQAGIGESGRVIAYCNGGVAATSVLFALSMVGHTRIANYDGSWNEWGERFDLPVEREG